MPRSSGAMRVAGSLLALAMIGGDLDTARGQGYGVSPSFNYSSGGTTYLPYGGGGFVPYSGGPSGGLGVQPRPAGPATRLPMTAPGGMASSMSPGLGPIPGSLTPLSPVRAMGNPRGGGMGGSMIQRGGGMGGMTRPPVGSYPFRIPPSLGGPSSPVMSMSM